MFCMIMHGFVDNLLRFINKPLDMFTLIDHVEPACPRAGRLQWVVVECRISHLVT
jgi:hypothetical protein